MANHIRLEETSKALSSLAGLSLFSSAFDRLVEPKLWDSLLPTYKITPQTNARQKLKALTLGLVSGASCLDDMDRLKEDFAFRAVNQERVNAARTYLDFLQQFNHEMTRKMNHALIEVALSLHQSQAKDDKFILSCDSTDSEQSGLKIEGCTYNYKNHWALDTLVAFDQYGFQYWHEVRPGSTYTSNGSPEVIHQVFKRVPRSKHRYFLGDSGFCNSAVFKACEQRRADFVIASKANMYQRFIPLVKDWKPSKKIKFHDGRKVEIGHTVYVTKESETIYRLVVLRAKAKEATPLFQDEKYEYAAFVTTISQHNMSDEAIIELYRTRANCENFIKDLKMGFDMYHYPCQKLTANKAYGVMMALAYNLTRYAGYLLSPNKPMFAKAVRFLLVHIPCLVVRHARQITFKMPTDRLKEVLRLYDKINTLGYYASS